MSYTQSIKSLSLSLGLSALSVVGFTTHADAQGSIPEYMPYQGFVSDTSGAPVNGSVNLTFKLYEDLVSTTPLWEESADNVAVVSGAFATDLGGTTPDLRNYLYSGQARYIGVSVNGGPELSPRTRLGSLPYAFLSYNALRFDGHPVADFVTQEQFNEFTLTVTGGLSADDVNGLIDARGYLNQAAITALVNGLIDDRGYLTEAEVNQRITNATNQINTTISELEDRVDGLQTTINTLQGTVNNLQTLVQNSINQAGVPFILGVSNTSDNGWFQFTDGNGVSYQGVRAAGESCKASYPNDANAHYCSMSEIQTALSVGSYNAGINGQETWMYPSWIKSNGGFEGDNDFCQSLLYHSGHAAVGSSLTILTDVASTSGGSGIRLTFNDNKGCDNSLPVLCCR